MPDLAAAHFGDRPRPLEREVIVERVEHFDGADLA
jgi:hypothetical protein